MQTNKHKKTDGQTDTEKGTSCKQTDKNKQMERQKDKTTD